MASLRFRAPGSPLPLLTLLARALPQAREAVLARAVRGGSVRVEGRVQREAGLLVAPGSRVAGELPQPDPLALAPRLRLRGPDFAVLETQPGGMPPTAAMLDLGPGAFFPVLQGDCEAHALWLVALDELARARLLAAMAGGGLREEHALVVAPPWPSGALETGEATPLRFEVVREHDGVAELALQPGALAPDAVRETLARAGCAVLGDARFGGRLVAGGLRLWSERLLLPDEGIDVSCEPPKDLLPAEPIFPAEAGRGARSAETASLAVSQATLRAVARGHPWVLTDTETGDAGRFREGSLVALRGPGGEPGGLARVEGEGPLAARIWSRREAARDGGSVEARVAAALARRRRLLDAAETRSGTDAFRLVHGEADGLPGLAIDRLGSCLRVLVTGRACVQITARAVDAVVRMLAPALGADPAVVEVVHLRARPAGVLTCVRLARGAFAPEACGPDGQLVVRERGLAFEVDPGLGDATHPSPGIGLYLDQRENRDRLARRARGGRWLNLFAHTGAFSVALLAAGAAEVTSVDLSAAWLRCLERSLERNRLDVGRHRSVKGDSRRFLERLPGEDRFDGIVLDPPTAAAAGRRFWSVRRDLEPLLESALGRLAPGGCLLICRNDRAGGHALPALVRRVAARAGVALADVAPALPGEDFPSLPGFPEGDPFEGALAVVAG